MKKKILITACSLEVGGIERSLVGLLNVFDYEKYDVDVLLFSKKGEFLPLVKGKCNFLPEIPQCATLLDSIKSTVMKGHFMLGLSRVLSKIETTLKYKNSEYNEDAKVFAYLQSNWDKSIHFMPKIKTEYDACLSFMWPHHFAAFNVKAKKKIAWIHTDYTKAALDREKDENVWNKFDSIAAVSDECGEVFLKVYPSLREKVVTVENILEQNFVREQSEEFVPEEMAGEDVKILTVGRMCYPKAFDRIVSVCEILKKRNLPFKWYAIGYGTEEAAVKALADEKGVADRMIFLGKRINPYPFMKECDIYAQPSRYEGKAVTVREAQMLGRPVLITDFDTARGQVKEGFDAVIVEQDEEKIADGIEKLIKDENERKRLSQNAYSTDYGNASEIQKIYDLI